MVRLALLGSLAVSLSGLSSAAVIDGRDPKVDGGDDLQPFMLRARNILKARNTINSDVVDINGGINVNWTDDATTTNMTAKRQCIVGEGPAYFPVNNIGYFARDACNTVMNGHHGAGEANQLPGTYTYLSPAYQQDAAGGPKVAVMVTAKLHASVLTQDAGFSCLNMLAHFYDTSGEGWCVTNTDKHVQMTQGGKVIISNKGVQNGKLTWSEWLWGVEKGSDLLELKLDPAKCTDKGDPCDNKAVVDDSYNQVLQKLPIGAQQKYQAGSTHIGEGGGQQTIDPPKPKDELKARSDRKGPGFTGP